MGSEEVELVGSTHSFDERPTSSGDAGADADQQQTTPVGISPRDSKSPKQRPPTSTLFSPSPCGFEPQRALPTPYEVSSYTDDTLTTIRRRQPSIERNWHASKCRKSLSGMMLDELGGERGGVYNKAAMYFGPKKQAERRAKMEKG